MKKRSAAVHDQAPARGFLALDASTRTASVAVGTSDGIFASVTLGPPTEHGSALLPAVDYVLGLARHRPGDLRGVVVAAGPGSFTGLRVAAATAKAIAHAAELPFFAFGGLFAEAAASGFTDREVWALFDARREDVFAAGYRFRSQPVPAVDEIFGPEALPLSELLARVDSAHPPAIIGEGAWLHREQIREVLGPAVVPPIRAASRAAGLLWLAGVAGEYGRVVDPAGWQPDYVRASGAERIAAERAGAVAVP